MICRRYFVSGRVQGVFYRGSAQHQANLLGLKGWARNLADGRVEILACTSDAVSSESGQADILIDFEKWLEIGPEYAKVTKIEVINVNIDDIVGDLSDGFEVKSTAR